MLKKIVLFAMLGVAATRADGNTRSSIEDEAPKPILASEIRRTQPLNIKVVGGVVNLQMHRMTYEARAKLSGCGEYVWTSGTGGTYNFPTLPYRVWIPNQAHKTFTAHLADGEQVLEFPIALSDKCDFWYKGDVVDFNIVDAKTDQILATNALNVYPVFKKSPRFMECFAQVLPGTSRCRDIERPTEADLEIQFREQFVPRAPKTHALQAAGHGTIELVSTDGFDDLYRLTQVNVPQSYSRYGLEARVYTKNQGLVSGGTGTGSIGFVVEDSQKKQTRVLASLSPNPDAYWLAQARKIGCKFDNATILIIPQVSGLPDPSRMAYCL